MSKIADDLRKADDYKGNWYGYLTNQAGHAAVIGVPLGTLSLNFMHPVAALISVFFIYFVVWEMLIQQSELLWDSIVDACHVVAGAGAVAILVCYIPYEDRNTALLLLWCGWTVWFQVLMIGVKRRI